MSTMHRTNSAAGESQADLKPTRQVPAEDISLEDRKRVFHQVIPSTLTRTRKRSVLSDFIEDIGREFEDDAALMSYQQFVGESFGYSLVNRGLISKSQLEKTLDSHRQTGQPLWRVLLQLRFIEREQLEKLLRTDLLEELESDSRFCRWLVKHGIISEKKLGEARAAAVGRAMDLVEYLRHKNIVDDQSIARAIAAELGLPYDDLSDLNDPPYDVIRRFPLPMIQRYETLPFDIDDHTVSIAFADREDLIDIQKFDSMTEYVIRPVVVPRSKLHALLKLYDPENLRMYSEDDDPSEKSVETSRFQPVAETMSSILLGLINNSGSDIHIEPEKTSYRVRYRVDGLLHDVIALDREIGKKVTNRIKTMSGIDPTLVFSPQDGHLLTTVRGSECNFRISTLPTPDGEKVVLRYVQTHYMSCSLQVLGMTVAQRRTIKEILDIPSGMVLAAGPAGSGKSTTVYSLMNCINLFTQNLMTIEDPIEYELVGANQAEVNPKMNLSFALGLRAILRQDPDVIMVGEIRDQETATIAVRAAMTGHKVFSTVHATSAINAIISMLQLGLRPFILGTALSGIIYQRLVRKVCTGCKSPGVADDSLKRELGIPLDEDLEISHGRGCKKCFYTGFHGRTGVFEILQIDDDFRFAMAENPTPGNLEKLAEAAHISKLRDHVVDLLRDGTISAKEALQIC